MLSGGMKFWTRLAMSGKGANDEQQASGQEDIAFSAVPHKGNNFKKGVYECA